MVCGISSRRALFSSAGSLLVRVSFGIRLPNGLAPSSPRPKASVSLSEFRCAVYTVRTAWLSKSRQGRSGRDTSSLFSSTTIPLVTKEVELLEDHKKVWEAIVHIHNSQNQWIPPSVNRQRIHRRSIFKSGTAGACSPSSTRRSRRSNVT